MSAAEEAGKSWDVIVLDPPKLAPSKKVLAKATNKYMSLNMAAMKILKPGGILMTCSCSSAMTQSNEFVPMVVSAARKLHRSISVLREAGASADHILNPAYPSGKYLTNLTCRVN
jgi:23S rRNA G2069 N7-methylase RlmK/C1962 C5-methylase RlmI